MRETKNKKGITLISLVITIIVLLIIDYDKINKSASTEKVSLENIFMIAILILISIIFILLLIYFITKK